MKRSKPRRKASSSSVPEEESSRSGTPVLPWFEPLAAVQTPWLMLPSWNARRSVASFFIHPHCIGCNINMPELFGLQRCHGIFHGWLLIGHDSSKHWLLLNPVNGARRALPPWQFKEPLRHFAMSSSPADPGCVMSSPLTEHIAFCHPGDTGWIVHDHRWVSRVGSSTDFTFCNGKYYWLRSWQWLIAVDFLGGGDATQIYLDRPDPRGDERHSYNFLVELGGKLLLVIASDDWTSCKVFCADLQKPQWVAIESLGGHALFLGRGCSVAVPAAEGVPGNHIFICFHPFMEKMGHRRGYPRWFWLAFVLGFDHQGFKFALPIDPDDLKWEPCHWFVPNP